MIVLNPDSPNLVGIVSAGDTVMWGQAAAEPIPLTHALMAQRHLIGSFSVFLGTTWSSTIRPDHADCVSFSSYCGSGTNRTLAKAGVLDILPCHYSQIGSMIRSGKLKVDVVMLQLAAPDSAGRYSLSIAHEYLVPAISAAHIVIAEINELAPFTFGELTLNEANIDFAIHTRRPPVAPPIIKSNETELAIARHVSNLVEDGSTLQCGVGSLPERILAQLSDRRDLGVHTGTLGDQIAILTMAGIVTNAHKSIDRGVTVAGIMMGSQLVHDFANLNPAVQFRSTEYTHSPGVLASIDRLVAINSAIEVDLTGQVNAEVAGGCYIGGVGGALDFVRGAHRSKGGLPIFALPSRVGIGAKSASRIVARLNGPVSTPRSDVGIIVTEYGIADLRGLSISERIRRMIAIAHPEVREDLARDSWMLRTAQQ